MIRLEIALDIKRLKQYIVHNPDIFKSCVLVQGSSHSAALVVWNLLECGVQVKQIMNKPYAYYSRRKNADGSLQIYHENDGLKGKVAEFTRKLQANEIYADKWSYEIVSPGNVVDYTLFSRIIAAIGFQPVNTLMINGISSAKIKYNLHTTETEVPGVFAVGVGYPPEAADGSKNVGISKFWPDLGEAVSVWQERPISLKVVGEPYRFFHTIGGISVMSPGQVMPRSHL